MDWLVFFSLTTLVYVFDVSVSASRAGQFDYPLSADRWSFFEALNLRSLSQTSTSGCILSCDNQFLYNGQTCADDSEKLSGLLQCKSDCSFNSIVNNEQCNQLISKSPHCSSLNNLCANATFPAASPESACLFQCEVGNIIFTEGNQQCTDVLKRVNSYVGCIQGCSSKIDFFIDKADCENYLGSFSEEVNKVCGTCEDIFNEGSNSRRAGNVFLIVIIVALICLLLFCVFVAYDNYLKQHGSGGGITEAISVRAHNLVG